MKIILFSITTIASVAASAAVPLRWTVETSRAQPATFEAYQGETLELEAALTSYGKPLEAPSNYSLYWQTNGMGSTYWEVKVRGEGEQRNDSSAVHLDPSPSPTNVMFATWSPTNDIGAKTYTCFIGQPGTIYHAAFQLRLRPSPGAVPNELPLPVKTIDFSQVTVLNPPWITEESDPTVPAWAKNPTPPVTQESDPTVPAWAKEPIKPPYTASEVGAATPQDVTNKFGEIGPVKSDWNINTGKTSIGSEAEATGRRSTAIGAGTKAQSPNSIAMGTYAVSTNGNQAIAIGNQANGSATNSTAIGNLAQAIDYNSIAIGSGAKANKRYSIAIGDGARSDSAIKGIAIGSQAASDSQETVVIGANASVGVRSTKSIAIGSGAKVNVNKSGAKVAVQIGTGTNPDEGTIQFLDKKLATEKHVEENYQPKGDYLTATKNATQGLVEYIVNGLQIQRNGNPTYVYNGKLYLRSDDDIFSRIRKVEVICGEKVAGMESDYNFDTGETAGAVYVSKHDGTSAQKSTLTITHTGETDEDLTARIVRDAASLTNGLATRVYVDTQIAAALTNMLKIVRQE